MFFSKTFKKTAEKAEDTITQVGDGAKDVMSDAKTFIQDGKDKLGVLFVIAGVCLVTTLVANVMTVVCCGKTMKSINKNNTLMEIERLLRH